MKYYWPLLTLYSRILTLKLVCLCFSDLSDVLGLAIHGNYIYWTDRGNSDMTLGRADKSSGVPSETLLSDISGLHGLVAVNKSADPGWKVIATCTCI
jgi:hypothetical protein